MHEAFPVRVHCKMHCHTEALLTLVKRSPMTGQSGMTQADSPRVVMAGPEGVNNKRRPRIVDPKEVGETG